eukprot:scaffold3892_cov255-Pinguiococcus_pyrenoidosus.AAC.3
MEAIDGVFDATCPLACTVSALGKPTRTLLLTDSCSGHSRPDRSGHGRRCRAGRPVVSRHHL